jgi:RNA polymerase sigma-70 factor (ECF subfamily)
MMSATAEAEALHHLVVRAQQGDRAAADRIVRENDGWVRSVILGVTGRADQVDDIAQQVWTQVWERLNSLREPHRLRSWLYSVARFAAIDAGVARRRRQSAATALDPAADVPDPRDAQNPAAVAAHGELRSVLLEAVRSLPALYREPFVLRHLEDWSYARIGECLGLPVETVETRLARARRMLREMLKDHLEA